MKMKKKKKKNSEIYITTQLSLTMFKPVSTFTYFEKKTQFKFALTRFSALSKIERSLVQWTWKIQGAQHMICMEKLRFSCHPRAIVRHQGPLGSARIQPWLQKKKTLRTSFGPEIEPCPSTRVTCKENRKWFINKKSRFILKVGIIIGPEPNANT